MLPCECLNESKRRPGSAPCMVPLTSVFALVDPALILKALNQVGEELRDRRMLGEIMVSSGHVFLLRYGWTDDGNPIEHVDISFDGKDGPIR